VTFLDCAFDVALARERGTRLRIHIEGGLAVDDIFWSEESKPADGASAYEPRQ
jgi:hypothetical protein